MTNSIAVSPEQFIFAQDKELKTTSLKVAEAFGKEHKNILRDIDKTLSQVSDSFGKLNFEPTEYEYKNNLGLPVKSRMFNVTKDGFMFLVMGFTGKKAAGIKEAYINAFNLMHKKLFPVRNALVVITNITPRQQRHIQGVVKNLVNTQVGSTYSIVWGSVKKQFDVGTYKDIPEAKYPDLCKFLKCKPLEGELLPINQSYTALPAPVDAYLKDTKKRVSELKQWALKNNHNEVADDLDVIQRCLVSSWTHADESLIQMANAVRYLERWRNS